MSFVDGFPGSSLDSRWTDLSGGGTSSVAVANGVLTVDIGTDDGRAVYLDTPLDFQKDWAIEVTARLVSGALVWPLFFFSESGGPTITDTGLASAAIRFARVSSPADEIGIDYWIPAGTRVSWDADAETWTATPSFTGPTWRVGDWMRFQIENDGTNERWRAFTIGGNQPATETTKGEVIGTHTDWVDWADVRGGGANLYLVLGAPVNQFAAVFDFERVRLLDDGTIT